MSENSFASNGKENSSETGAPHETLPLKMFTKKLCGCHAMFKKEMGNVSIPRVFIFSYFPFRGKKEKIADILYSLLFIIITLNVITELASFLKELSVKGLCR